MPAFQGVTHSRPRARWHGLLANGRPDPATRRPEPPAHLPANLPAGVRFDDLWSHPRA